MDNNFRLANSYLAYPKKQHIQALSRANSPPEYKCNTCGERFNLLGDMERHILLEHLQKEDIVLAKSQESGQKDTGEEHRARRTSSNDQEKTDI
jgi:hypothetical protein